jgi:hypothetical protein
MMFAAEVLDGRTTVHPSLAARVAALPVRTALEERLDDLCSSLHERTVKGNGRSKRICVRTLIDEQLGATVDQAYSALSTACHQHAYDLSPTVGEIRHLMGMVTTVLDWRPPADGPPDGRTTR